MHAVSIRAVCALGDDRSSVTWTVQTLDSDPRAVVRTWPNDRDPWASTVEGSTIDDRSRGGLHASSQARSTAAIT